MIPPCVPAGETAPRDPTMLGELALAEAEERWERSFGVGARRELRAALALGLASLPCVPGEEDASHVHARLCAGVERELRARYGVRALSGELADERHRDAAVADDAALVSYEEKWSKRLARLQRAYPSRWRVPSLSDDEVRAELTLRLIDAVRTKPEERAKHARAGKAWGLLFLAEQRRRLQKDFGLEVVLADVTPVLDRAPTEEERWIAEEAAALAGLARERAEETLSRPQRAWFAAMRMAANQGSFFASSGKLNLAAASRVLDKDRSSALRAFGELQTHFVRELKKVGG